MSHQTISAAVFFCAAFFLPNAWAEIAGRVVLAEGDARIEGKVAVAGAEVNEGDLLKTGERSHLYIKTIDEGFFILRPSSTGRIVSYSIDPQNPSSNRIKLEVTEGVSRHISGEGSKKSRDSFRLNTPVAAIGVRGTDFTVFTTGDTTRVAVHSGGIVVSPFTGNCSPSGSGPCEGIHSRELFATQTGQVLQVLRGQETIQTLTGNQHSPDAISPQQQNEPKTGKISSHDGAKTTSELDLVPIKDKSLDSISIPLPQPTPQPVVPKPTTVAPLVWGRWESALGQGKEIDVTALLQSHQLIGTNTFYALLRSKEGTWQRPEQNSVAFSLQGYQAAVLNQQTQTVHSAAIENGSLSLDFAKSTFATKIDLISQSERFQLVSQGQITSDGKLSGNNQFSAPTNMAVKGVINTDNASAAYLFQSRLTQDRLATGVTYWAKIGRQHKKP